jgi:hypothetical protein
MSEVRPGQVWADNDWRAHGRTVLVLAVDETHATVQSPSGRGRKTRIRLDRFRPTSTGYRLVSEAKP